jgi:D-alanyl-D-alanine carboxypeptidase/D-alanyl-D-alanine-endopeptidase (penicillin-binding protein 4)
LSPRAAVFLAALLAPATLGAQAAAPPPTAASVDLPPAIRDVLGHPSLNGATVGLHAITLPEGEVLLSQNAGQTFAPASVTKLFTTAAALWKLGGHHVWRTPVAYRGTLDGDRLDGDLWILGRGAPDLVEERLWVAARWIAERGLTTITGDIVVDDRYFSGPVYGAGWPGGRQVTEAYHAAVTALMANYAAERGDDGWNAVEDPPLHFGNRFAEILGLAGVTVLGPTRRPLPDELQLVAAPDFRGADTGRRTVPEPLSHLYDIVSEPLGRLVMDVNKFSNNVMTESILRALGAIEFGAPGTDAKGVAVVAEFLQEELGFPADSFDQADGSGLSSQNRFSPEQVVALIRYAERDFHIGPELLASLKHSGLDGWNPAPFRYAPLKGELRVKSGHIRGVNTLGGILHTDADRQIVFAFMVNGHRAQQWEIDQRMAELTSALIRDF